MTYRCEECGSAEVHVCGWIDANTLEPTGGEGPIDDSWCVACAAHTSLDWHDEPTPKPTFKTTRRLA